MVEVAVTHVIAHADKYDAAETDEAHLGLHPLLASVDHGPSRLRESIAGLLRPGNAGWNSVVDHHDLFAQLRAGLPVTPEDVLMLVRCDAAGASYGFVDALADAGSRAAAGFRATSGSAPLSFGVLKAP